MKRIYSALCGLLLAFVLLLGLTSLLDRNPVFSPAQQRDLAKKPVFSAAGLIDGSWFHDLQVYYSDHFPSRENLLELYFFLDRSDAPAVTEPVT